MLCWSMCVIFVVWFFMFRFFFLKQKTAYEMRISDWSSDVCSSDLFPDGCGGSGGVQELAKAGRAEALGGSCGEYDALEMGQADAREGRPRHEDDRDGGLSGMTETVETTENAARPIPA